MSPIAAPSVEIADRDASRMRRDRVVFINRAGRSEVERRHAPGATV